MIIKDKREYMKKYNKRYKRIKTKDIKQYMKNYKSTDAFKRRRRENLKYYKCECGGKYDSEHKKSHVRSKKHQKYNNKILLEIIEELYNMDMFICEFTEKILNDLDKNEEGSFFDSDDDFLLNDEPLEDFKDIDDIDDFDISDFEDLEDYDIF